MNGVLIFAGLFSAPLTSLIIDRTQGFQASVATDGVLPATKRRATCSDVFYRTLCVHSVLSSSTFSPSSSDVQVNAYWFISPVTSLPAALLETLVQQWVRNYMHVFQ
ncbi:hypothetical protein H4582DRAFT_159100 [Lactarius indigo]|nr:hypothetical protein H4582DRAFT_159100 [Lactarius indigo]